MTRAAGPDGRPSLEAIRRQLRELGYLKGPLSPLEGWMLAGSGGPSSFLGISLVACLRVGLIGGPLLGIPAAASVALANRPHVGGARDLILLSLYLSGILGLLLAALELTADLVLSWMARRGFVLVGGFEKIAARVGLLFFAATTLYLAALARGGRSAALLSDRGGAGWIVWGGAVLAALAVGHLIGRMTGLGSLIALAAAGGVEGIPRSPGSPRRRRGALAVAAILLPLAALLVFLPPGGARPGATAVREPFRPADVPGRIVLVGIDGLDAPLLERAAGRGVCPGLARMRAEGALYRVSAEGPAVPPAVWTTIATGRPPAEHGILGYQARRIPGLSAPVQDGGAAPLALSLRLLLPGARPARTPVSAGMRREKTVWEILSEEGVATAAVNWWATWPAAGGEGIVVSERAIARLSAGVAPDRDIAPAGLEKELADRFQQDIALARDGLADGELAGPELIDAWHGLVATRLFEGGLARVLMVYLPGLDIARSREVGGEEDPPPLPDLILSRADRIVSGLRDRLRADDLLLVLGDPGRSGGADGVLLVAGARVAPRPGGRAIRRVDIAPTLLALAGFPPARDLAGGAVLDFLGEGDPAGRVPPSIATYGPRSEPLPGPASDPFDPEVIERLRSLGYIN